MAEVAEIFRVLDDGTGAGEPLDKKEVGDAPGTGNGLIGFSFVDSSGNVVLPMLNASGQLPVTLGTAGTPVSDEGLATPAGLNTDTTVCTLTLVASAVYNIQFFTGSSFKPCIWRVEQTDDATDTVRARFVTGPGDYNYSSGNVDCIQITAGAVGTQEINLIAQQLRGGLSDMHGTICATQLP